MRKDKSWTQMAYEAAYCYMRRGIYIEFIRRGAVSNEHALKAADYSFQAYGHESTGWINKRRHRRFLEIKWRILTQREELPF